jgi:hypothetical protein
MQVGDPIGEGWATFKRFWRHLLPIAFVVSLVVSLAELALAAAGGVLGTLGAILVSTVGAFVIQAALVEAVADVRDGRADLSLGETIGRVLPRLGQVIGASFLAGIAIAIGFVLVVVPGLYLMTIWSVVIPVLLLEHTGVTDAFGRSRALVSGYGWTVFGVILVTFLIQLVVSIALAIAFAGLSNDVGHYIGGVITTTLVTPFVSATWTSMYFRLRDAHGGVADGTPALPAGAAYSDTE